MQLKDILSNIQESLPLFFPEIGLVAGIVLLLLLDLFLSEQKRGVFKYFTSGVLVAVYGFSVSQYCPLVFGSTLFEGKLLLGKESVILKLLFELTGLGVVLFAIFDKNKFKKYEGRVEYYVLILAVVLGAHLMVMAENLLVVFISIELVSLSSYVLTAIDKDKKKGFEGSIKYLVFGVVASAFMLYGMSWVYGLSGSLDFKAFQYLITPQQNWFVSLILLFVLLGFLFKIAAVPMHSWVPDVYQSAPNSIVALFSIIPKLAGLMVLYHFVSALGINITLNKVIIVISIVSICIGNLGAFWQKDIKRMLAYSSIAHAGFLLIGLFAASDYALKAILFYGFMLMIANLGAFFLIRVLWKYTNSTQLETFSGLGRRLPLLGIAATIVMACLTGCLLYTSPSPRDA